MLNINEEKISKIVEEAIRNLIKEEQGISDIVIKESNKIINEIRRLIYNSEKKSYEGFSIRSNRFNITIFEDYEININFDFYNFSDEYYYEQFISNNSNIFIGKSSFNMMHLELCFFGIHGEIDEKTLNDQCQHEVSHLFMSYMKKGDLLSAKRKKLYSTASDLMNSKGNGGFDNLVGTIVYASFEEEQNAFVNGMYNLLVSTCQTTMDVNKIWRQSDAFVLFKKLKYFYEVLNSDELDEEDINNLNNSLSKLRNKDSIWLKNKLSLVIKTYGNKLIKGYNKALNDIRDMETKKGYMY